MTPPTSDSSVSQSKRGRLPLHPLLFAIVPVLFLYAHNAGRYSPKVVLAPLAATLGLSLLVWLVSGLLLRSRSRGALLTTLFLVAFLSYGHLSMLLDAVWIDLGFIQLGPARVLGLIYVVVLPILTLLLARSQGKQEGAHLFAHLVGFFLLASSLVQIGAKLAGSESNPGASAVSGIRLEPEDGAPLPHIVYIVLDGYAREDVLEDVYGYTGNSLIDYLERSGFHVVEESRSNYCQTTLSLASSLSMELLDELAAEIGADSEDRQPLRTRIKENEVAALLRPLGYQYAAFATGYFSTEARNADVFLAPWVSLNEFENVLFDTTPLPRILHNLGKNAQEKFHRERILFTLDHLSDPLRSGSPAFVFAHIVAPHPPFVFGRDGELATYPGNYTLADGDDLVGTRGIEADDYRRLYLDQLIYLNGRIIEGLERLLSSTDDPLIVIVQADHGPGSGLIWEDPAATDLRERLSILNAYYSTDQNYEFLYGGITPVNSFRMIFNQYFGTNLTRVPDRSYFSTESQPYTFYDVTEELLPSPPAIPRPAEAPTSSDAP